MYLAVFYQLNNCYFCSAVDLGRRYFPSCSHVLDNFINEESALTILGSGTPEDKVRMRICKLREDVKKAFSKDKAAGAGDAPIASKASSSSSPRYNKTLAKGSEHGNFCSKFKYDLFSTYMTCKKEGKDGSVALVTLHRVVQHSLA